MSEPANNLITGLTNTVDENPFRDHQLIDSIRSNRDEEGEEEEEEEEEEIDEAERGFIMEKVDKHLEFAPTAGDMLQQDQHFNGAGVGRPHFDERPLDGGESEGDDEEDEEEGFQQQNFVTNEIRFTGGGEDFRTIETVHTTDGTIRHQEQRDTLDLTHSRTHHQDPIEEEDDGEEEKVAEEQF